MIISSEISTNHAGTVMVLKFVKIILCLQIYLIYTQQFTVGISKKKKNAKKSTKTINLSLSWQMLLLTHLKDKNLLPWCHKPKQSLAKSHLNSDDIVLYHKRYYHTYFPFNWFHTTFQLLLFHMQYMVSILIFNFHIS